MGQNGNRYNCGASILITFNTEGAEKIQVN
jgi:hypothetical protein